VASIPGPTEADCQFPIADCQFETGQSRNWQLAIGNWQYMKSTEGIHHETYCHNLATGRDASGYNG
jgi:hypothetical protein